MAERPTDLCRHSDTGRWRGDRGAPRSRFLRKSRVTGLAIAVGGLGLLGGPAAGATPNGPIPAASSLSQLTPTLTLKIAVGPPTTVTKAKGSGYPTDDAITITFDTTTATTATSSSSGAFAAPFTVPASGVIFITT